jgi:hypothetical protein
VLLQLPEMRLEAMLIAVSLVAGALVVASLPYWLPAAIVGLRMRIFTHIKGDQGIGIPGNLVDASRFQQVYSHPAADGRSKGAALSGLFWYWLSPGPEIHQKHLEPGERSQAPPAAFWRCRRTKRRNWRLAASLGSRTIGISEARSWSVCAT